MNGEFFNHPAFKYLENGVVKNIGNGWTEKSKVICEDTATSWIDVARNYKQITFGPWREYDENRIVELLQTDQTIKTFLDEMKEGDKIESYVAFRDMLASSGGWRIVRNGEHIKHYCCWVS